MFFDKSELLRKVRGNKLFSQIDDMFGLSRRSKKRRDIKLSREILETKYVSGNNAALLNKCCVAMFDGTVNQGGLCDRLWGAVSVYNYCKRNDIPYKLNFVQPFHLLDYLEPNLTDWRIGINEISYNKDEAVPIVVKCLGYGREDDLSVIGNCDEKQVHVYTNAHSYKKEFGEKFNELFRPAKILQQAIDDVIAKEGDEYVSISFRFVRLFGDFEDIAWPVLPDDESRENMIRRGLQAIEKVKSLHPGMKVLVTTDSQTFLERARDVDNVFVVEGEIRHVDFSNGDTGDLVHLKTFLDLMLISKAKHVYLGVNNQVYKSTFAKTAAQIGSKPFDTIEF